MTDVKVRFAPRPPGNLHVGNLRTALVNYLFARREGGHFMLRIDDTDTERSTPEFEASIRADLEWMGMNWDSEDRQSARLDRYDAALKQLADAGRAYPCYETPEELALKRKAQLSAGRPPVYDRAALKLTDEQKAEHAAAGGVRGKSMRPIDRWRVSGKTPCSAGVAQLVEHPICNRAVGSSSLSTSTILPIASCANTL